MIERIYFQNMIAKNIKSLMEIKNCFFDKEAMQISSMVFLL